MTFLLVDKGDFFPEDFTLKQGLPQTAMLSSKGLQAAATATATAAAAFATGEHRHRDPLPIGNGIHNCNA